MIRRIPIASYDGGQIIVQGYLNGEPVFLLFDSGAVDPLYVEQRTGAALELPIVGQTTMSVAHRDLHAVVPVYGPLVFQAGDVLFENLYCNGVASGRADGLMGIGAMLNQSFCVDLERREIRVGR